MRLALIICLFLTLAAPALAETPPPLPHSVYGTVDIADGSLIEAWGEERGYRYATGYTFWYEDAGGVVFGIALPGDDPTTETVEGALLGEIVTFFAENVGWAAEKLLWMSGASELLNLHFEGGAMTTPTLTASPQLRLVIGAPNWPSGENRGYLRVCAEYGQERICVTVWLEVP